MGNYADLLKNPKWQKKRLKIFERDEFACKLCGAEDKTLCVHHVKYKKGKPWEIEDKFLVTLCEDCHSTAENKYSTNQLYYNFNKAFMKLYQLSLKEKDPMIMIEMGKSVMSIANTIKESISKNKTVTDAGIERVLEKYYK